MSRRSLNAHINSPNADPMFVFFSGTTALKEGQGVCYNWDWLEAGDYDQADPAGRRMNEVEVPTILNAPYFAGVAARAYAASTTGQMIEIYPPGSVCNVWSVVSNTIGTRVSTCLAGGTNAGYFAQPGFPGEGTFKPLQTIDRSSTAGLCFGRLDRGDPSYLIEDLTPAAAGGAITCMVGGVTYFSTAVTLSNDATFTLADGVIPGQKKAFVCQAAMTTNNIVVTVTSGVQGIANADPTTALATITLDADLEETTVEWDAFDTNGLWVLTHTVGSTLG